MVKHGSRRHRMKRGGGGGGDSEVRPHGAGDVDLGNLHEITDSTGKITLDLDNQSGGRKSRKHHRHTKKCRHVKKTQKTRKARKHGGGVLSTAVLPFGLFGLQKYFQRNRTAKRGVKGLGNKVKSGFKGIRKMF